MVSCKEDKPVVDEDPKLKTYEKLGMDTNHKAVYEALVVGSDAPDFSGTDQYGNVHDLNSLTKDSSLVVIFYRGNGVLFVAGI